MKQSNPLEVPEYTVANKLVSESAFQSWIPTTVRRRDRIISKLHKRYMQRQQKFGIDLRKNVQEAYLLDAKNGKTKWENAISKEMKNVYIPFTSLKMMQNSLSPANKFVVT